VRFKWSRCGSSQGIYPLGYYPHNIHFQTWAALMLGKRSEALSAARKVASKVPRDFAGNDWALFQTFASMPLVTMVRFGQWDSVLAEPKPPAKWHYMTGIWHYARGMAFAHTQQPDAAARELGMLQALIRDAQSQREMIGFSNAPTLLTIAGEVLTGEMAAKQKRFTVAIDHLERAVALEDGLMYNEPPDWYYPVRHTLGAVLLEAGQPEKAETVYRQDLKRCGWKPRLSAIFPAERIRGQIVAGHLIGRTPASIALGCLVAAVARAFDGLTIIFQVFEQPAAGENLLQRIFPDIAQRQVDPHAGHYVPFR
jgi:tetratricopeptide (TPR) repeat protein